MTTSPNSSRKDPSETTHPPRDAERARRAPKGAQPIATLEQLGQWLDVQLAELETDNEQFITRRSLKGSLRR